MDITRRDGLLLAGAAVLAPHAAHAAEGRAGSVTPKQFDAWIALRGGLDGPGYWYSEGLVRSLKDGSVQSRMQGVETWITLPRDPKAPQTAVSISRKIYFFLRPDADEIVTDDTGKPRRPSIFAYQVRTFTLKGGAVQYAVQSHDLNSVRDGAPGSVYTFTGIGDQVHVNYAIFRNGTTAEVYDYFDHGSALKDLPQRYQMTWMGASTAAGTVANQRGWRIANFEAVPNAWVKKTIREKFPMWMAPPKDMAEIERLRGTVPYKVDGL